MNDLPSWRLLGIHLILGSFLLSYQAGLPLLPLLALHKGWLFFFCFRGVLGLQFSPWVDRGPVPRPSFLTTSALFASRVSLPVTHGTVESPSLSTAYAELANSNPSPWTPILNPTHRVLHSSTRTYSNQPLSRTWPASTKLQLRCKPYLNLNLCRSSLKKSAVPPLKLYVMYTVSNWGVFLYVRWRSFHLFLSTDYSVF